MSGRPAQLRAAAAAGADRDLSRGAASPRELCRARGGSRADRPTATESLARWIETTKGATSGAKTKDHLVAAAFAIDPGSVPGMTQGQPSLDASLGLSPTRAPTLVTAKREEATFDVHVSGPLPKMKIEASRTPASPRAK